MKALGSSGTQFKVVILCLFLILGFVIVGSAGAVPGKILVANDEQTLWEVGGYPPNAQPYTYVVNVANWFSGGVQGGTFLNDHGILQNPAQAALATAGYAVTSTWDAPISWTLSYLSGFKGIFIGAYGVIDSDLLISYVNGGGNVYIGMGTGYPPYDNQWDPFLHQFGLQVQHIGNGVDYGSTGVETISSTHPIFHGVTGLYQSGGQYVSLYGVNPYAQILAKDADGNGLYGVYSQVPLPGALWLLAPALAGLVGLRRRFRK